MDSTLKKIIDTKKIEVAAKSQLGIYKTFEKKVSDYAHDTISMKHALVASDTGIIAEFKRQSPSRRAIHTYANPGIIVPAYQQAGASACSVLTDTTFFGGSPTDLSVARAASSLPLLRKDFIIDPGQLYEARIFGADAVLLIASVLDRDTISTLTALAHSLQLEVLLEIHNEQEADKIVTGIDMIGVNNRNLADFSVDLVTSEKLFHLLPQEAVKISESGIDSPDDIRRLRNAGYRGFLVGTAFMSEGNPGDALSELIDGLKR